MARIIYELLLLVILAQKNYHKLHLDSTEDNQEDGLYKWSWNSLQKKCVTKMGRFAMVHTACFYLWSHAKS